MKTNQHAQIIEYMKEKGKITRFTAMVRLGVCNLPQRIIELKAKGFNIGDRMIKHVNRNGRKTSYKEYFLIGENDNANN